MSPIASNAVSGMNAATRRLEVSASNVANAMSTGALPDASGNVPAGAPKAYDPLTLMQSDAAGGGTQTTIAKASNGTSASYQPTAPFANKDGLVAAPNVDLAQEMISQLVAKYTFAANARVLKATDEMSRIVVDMKV
ncbi:putative flagellar basal-body rod protein (flgC) [Bradyrhizobium sp. ORS 285]|uniref:flagellar basal body rod protein FlgC n=1 Tax=Bradyrhizobium sp. ORS 285 TaxID=115808 RepID=UPI000240677C|nr:flagellar basal body rod C-terminal domain-containing protein [Bradyrhizobium sp. ORS 285]CCD86055.1 putative flagellar basal-body rod protein (flgC) [Bradyrhizobium sp. ORS 285]SMX61357.1 putative flagellar basal-body rod protein (flgC) [Bradyrhizobium sp. ORS 285]